MDAGLLPENADEPLLLRGTHPSSPGSPSVPPLKGPYDGGLAGQEGLPPGLVPRVAARPARPLGKAARDAGRHRQARPQEQDRRPVYHGALAPEEDRDRGTPFALLRLVFRRVPRPCPRRPAETLFYFSLGLAPREGLLPSRDENRRLQSWELSASASWILLWCYWGELCVNLHVLVLVDRVLNTRRPTSPLPHVVAAGQVVDLP